MQNLSVAGIGTYSLLITTVLSLFGVFPEPGQVDIALNGIAAIASIVLMIIGQFKRADLKLGLFRKG